jgi:hypothetical protein
VIPVRADGRPHLEARAVGLVMDRSATDVTVEFHFLARPLAGDLVLGIEGPDDQLRWIGATVASSTRTPSVTRALCRFGGRGEALLRPQSLTACFDDTTLRYVLGASTEILNAWTDLGVLRYQPRGVAVTCPICESIPAFRPGCSACGSSLIAAMGIIEHVRCGETSLCDDWRGRRFLYCAGCGEYGLASTGEFVCADGYMCAACGKASAERGLFAHCRNCWNYFPADLAVPRVIPGYDVCRFDPILTGPWAPAPAADDRRPAVSGQ